MIKPGELIDVVEITPLTLADRRIYNRLIDHAWDRIEEDVIHVIPKRELRGSHNVNDRVSESIIRLMGAVVQIRAERDGKPATLRVALLGSNVEHDRADGLLYYRFPDELRATIKESRVFARLRRDVMYALTSKYALSLYEMVQKRGNLDRQWSEEFTITEFRGLLGVPKGKLKRFADLYRRAIEPAVAEVNGLSDYCVKIRPVKRGRKFVALELLWWRKSRDELRDAWTELQRCKVGRKTRLQEGADGHTAAVNTAA